MATLSSLGKLLLQFMEFSLHVPYTSLQVLALFALIGEVGLVLDVLVDHVLHTFIGAVLQGLVKEVNFELEIKVLLGQLVDLAVLLFQSEIATAWTALKVEGGGVGGMRPLLRRHGAVTLVKLAGNGVGNANVLYVLGNHSISRRGKGCRVGWTRRYWVGES